MKQKPYSLTNEQLCTISSIIEKESYAYILESKDESFSIYANKLGRKKLFIRQIRVHYHSNNM